MTPKDHHEIGARGHEIEGSSDRSFGRVIAGFLAVLGATNWWHLGRAWPLYLIFAALLLAVALWRPMWLAPFNRIWTKIGFYLARVVNPIVDGRDFLCGDHLHCRARASSRPRVAFRCVRIGARAANGLRAISRN